jgi:hypothetical protein
MKVLKVEKARKGNTQCSSTGLLNKNEFYRFLLESVEAQMGYSDVNFFIEYVNKYDLDMDEIAYRMNDFSTEDRLDINNWIFSMFNLHILELGLEEDNEYYKIEYSVNARASSLYVYTDDEEFKKILEDMGLLYGNDINLNAKDFKEKFQEALEEREDMD